MKRAGMRRVQLIGWFSADTVSSTDAQIGLPPAYTDSSAVVRAARTSTRAPVRVGRKPPLNYLVSHSPTALTSQSAEYSPFFQRT